MPIYSEYTDNIIWHGVWSELWRISHQVCSKYSSWEPRRQGNSHRQAMRAREVTSNNKIWKNKQTKQTPGACFAGTQESSLPLLPPSHQGRLDPHPPLLCFHVPSSDCKSLFGDHSLILLLRQISPMKPCNDGWTRLDLWTPLNIVEASF